MHAAPHRPLCRSHNAFRPAIALWQQFVLPSRALLSQQRCSSAAAINEAPKPPSQAERSPKRRYPPLEDVATANRRQLKDIYPDDLAATLEAHRASNRATLIRNVASYRADLFGVHHVAATPGLGRAGALNANKTVGVGKNPSESDQQVESSQRGEITPKTHFHVVKSRMEVSTKHSQKNSPRSLAEAMDPMLRSEGSKSNLSRKDRRSLDSRWPSGRSFKMSEELLEYEGQNVLPISNTLVPENSLPWVVKFDTQSMNGIQRLALEISAFHAYMASTPKEKVARKAVIDQLTNLTRETLPDFKLELFGSERTNLSLATSDLDFRLFKPEQGSESLPQKAPRYKERKQWTVQLQKLHADIRRSGPYMLCNFRHARYPLISLQHRDSGIDIQVVLANDTALSREYVKKYLDEYPGLRELFSTIKVMFDVRGLSDVFRGGLGSYSLFMMAVASLKHMPHIQPNDLAQQLLSFLNFWASFDTYQLGISIEPAELFAKSSKTIATKAQKEKLDDTLQGRLKMGQVDIAQPYLLCLQDPAEATNDLGKKGFGIKHIQKTFMTLEKELRKDLQENTRASLLAPLVGSSYVLFKNRRKKMEEYGSSNEGNFN